jgi:hypothetical protein
MLESALSKVFDRVHHLLGTSRDHMVALAKGSDVSLDRLRSDVRRTEAGKASWIFLPHSSRGSSSLFLPALRSRHPDRRPTPRAGFGSNSISRKLVYRPENEIGPS